MRRSASITKSELGRLARSSVTNEDLSRTHVVSLSARNHSSLIFNKPAMQRGKTFFGSPCDKDVVSLVFVSLVYQVNSLAAYAAPSNSVRNMYYTHCTERHNTTACSSELVPLPIIRVTGRRYYKYPETWQGSWSVTERLCFFFVREI